LKCGRADLFSVDYDRGWPVENSLSDFTDDTQLFHSLSLNVSFGKDFAIHHHFTLIAVELPFDPLASNTLIVAEVGLLWPRYFPLSFFL